MNSAQRELSMALLKLLQQHADNQIGYVENLLAVIEEIQDAIRRHDSND